MINIINKINLSNITNLIKLTNITNIINMLNMYHRSNMTNLSYLSNKSTINLKINFCRSFNNVNLAANNSPPLIFELREKNKSSRSFFNILVI